MTFLFVKLDPLFCKLPKVNNSFYKAMYSKKNMKNVVGKYHFSPFFLFDLEINNGRNHPRCVFSPNKSTNHMETQHQMYGEAYTPAQIAERVTTMGVTKAKADALTLVVLAFMAGVFIALGAMLYTVVITDSTFGFGMTRWIGGLSFCLGLILVVIGGAELFTGNNLLAMAWAGKHITTREMLRNWAIVYTGNIIGGVAVALAIYWAESGNLAGGKVGETLVQIASTKAALTFSAGFIRGVLCNTLVCLAVWLAMGGRSVTDKILAILFPISGFVAMGFEHSVANWFFLPAGMLLGGSTAFDLNGMMTNLVSVTLGNVVGGSLLVAGIYKLAYLRGYKKKIT